MGLTWGGSWTSVAGFELISPRRIAALCAHLSVARTRVSEAAEIGFRSRSWSAMILSIMA